MKKSYNLVLEILISFLIIIGFAVSLAVVSVNTSAQGEGMEEVAFGGRVIFSWICTSDPAGAVWFVLLGPGMSSGSYITDVPPLSTYNNKKIPTWGSSILGFAEMEQGSCTFGYSPYEVQLEYQYKVTDIGVS